VSETLGHLALSAVAASLGGAAVFRTGWFAYLLTYGRPDTVSPRFYRSMRLSGAFLGTVGLVNLAIGLARLAGLQTA
jgi:hypothetical protein